MAVASLNAVELSLDHTKCRMLQMFMLGPSLQIYDANSHILNPIYLRIRPEENIALNQNASNAEEMLKKHNIFYDIYRYYVHRRACIAVIKKKKIKKKLN